MSATDTRMETIENAALDDVRPGDHLTWTETQELNGITQTIRREGTAHHRADAGNWFAKNGAWITSGEGEGITLTIRRPVKELPPERDGVVLVPADGHTAITTTDGQEFSRLTFTTKQFIWYGPNLAAALGEFIIQTTSHDRLFPGTWKVADQ